MEWTTGEPNLTDPARQALGLNSPRAYAAIVPEGPYAPAREVLVRVEREGVVENGGGGSNERAALAGLWLWHDFLDESHAISQSLDTPEGSFWHGIMHRREGDFWNAKYWFRRVGRLELTVAVGQELAGAGLPEGRWEPAAFTDLCEEVHRRPQDPRHAAAVALQRAEWRALFAHCVQQGRS